MSALNILTLPRCAILTTDAASYNADTGVVAGFGVKQAAIASWPGVLAIRGTALATLYIRTVGWKRFSWARATLL
jgi:hypothetical protein